MSSDEMSMLKRRTWIALIVFCVLLAATLYIGRERTNEAPTINEAELPKALDLSKADLIKIQRPSTPAVVLQKTGEQWKIAEPVPGDANQESVNNALSQLKSAHAVEIISQKKENYNKLDVSDDKAVHVIVSAQGNELANLWIGKLSGANTLVRFEGQENVYAMSGTFRYVFDRDLSFWQPHVEAPKEPEKGTKNLPQNVQKALHMKQ
jgi:hypothetical protein